MGRMKRKNNWAFGLRNEHFKGVWECGWRKETSWVFPVLILSPVKMVEETRGVKPKRTSICQSGCFRSVTLDFSVLTWLGWHDTACYCYCNMCNAFVCASRGCWFHYNLTCPNNVKTSRFECQVISFTCPRLKAEWSWRNQSNFEFRPVIYHKKSSLRQNVRLKELFIQEWKSCAHPLDALNLFLS